MGTVRSERFSGLIALVTTVNRYKEGGRKLSNMPSEKKNVHKGRKVDEWGVKIRGNLAIWGEKKKEEKEKKRNAKGNHE